MFLRIIISIVLCYVAVNVHAEVEIVVTASRVEEDVRSTPAYVRTIHEDEIRKGQTVLDALRSIPDITIRTFSPGEQSISMGGFGETGYARTLILVNGNPINRPDMKSINWMTISLGQVERIEIVKGPMSSRMGDQAVAGVVNIIMKKPGGVDAWVSLDYDPLTNTNNQGAGIAWANTMFRIGINAVRQDAISTRARSNTENIMADFSIGGTFGNWDIDLNGRYSSGNYELPGGLTKAQYDADPDLAVNTDDEFEEKHFGLDLNGRLKTDSAEFKVVTTWNRRDIQTDMVSWPSFTNTFYDNVGGTLQGSLQFPLGESTAAEAVGGVDAGWSQINLVKYEEAARTTKSSDETPNRLDLGFWVQGRLLIGSAWRVDTGVRLSRMKMQMGDADKTHVPFVFDAGASYVPNDTWNFSLRYGRIFRYPLMDEQAVYSGYGTASFNKELNPEYGHSFTASMEWRKGIFRVGIAPWFIAMTDEIAYDNTTSTNVNIDSTYHFGQVTTLKLEDVGFSAALAYSFDRAQFVETENQVPLVPNHSIFTPVDNKTG